MFIILKFIKLFIIVLPTFLSMGHWSWTNPEVAAQNDATINLNLFAIAVISTLLFVYRVFFFYFSDFRFGISR